MMRRKALIAIYCVLISTGALLLGEAGDGMWLTRVPQKERERTNPYDGTAQAIAAGSKLFRQNCASCHGSDGRGTEKHPNLHTEHIRNSTPGELEWLLKNGSMKNGMPSWSRLPEQQRWQIVSYLKSLQ